MASRRRDREVSFSLAESAWFFLSATDCGTFLYPTLATEIYCWQWGRTGSAPPRVGCLLLCYWVFCEPLCGYINVCALSACAESERSEERRTLPSRIDCGRIWPKEQPKGNLACVFRLPLSSWWQSCCLSWKRQLGVPNLHLCLWIRLLSSCSLVTQIVAHTLVHIGNPMCCVNTSPLTHVVHCCPDQACTPCISISKHHYYLIAYYTTLSNQCNCQGCVFGEHFSAAFQLLFLLIPVMRS